MSCKSKHRCRLRVTWQFMNTIYLFCYYCTDKIRLTTAKWKADLISVHNLSLLYGCLTASSTNHSSPPPRCLGVWRVAPYIYPSTSSIPVTHCLLPSPGMQALSSPQADRAWVRVTACQERRKMYMVDAHLGLVAGFHQDGPGSLEAMKSSASL